MVQEKPLTMVWLSMIGGWTSTVITTMVLSWTVVVVLEVLNGLVPKLLPLSGQPGLPQRT